MVTSCGANCLHIKWVYKTKRDENGKLVRYNARLVSCGKEQVSGRDYNVTFAAVMVMSSVKLILAFGQNLARPGNTSGTNSTHTSKLRKNRNSISI